MQNSLSRSWRNAYSQDYDDIRNDRVKHLIKQTESSIWPDWEVQFMGTIRMIQGDDESAVLEKSGIVIKKLESTKLAGKLTLSLLPKFKAKDLAPIMNYALLRASNMDYYPLVRLNFTGTSLGPNCMRTLANTVLDHHKYPYLEWINFTQCGITNKTKKKKKAADEEEKDEFHGLDACSILAAGLSKNKSLKFLLLNKNPSIDADGFKSILDSISKHPSLRCLWYNSNRLTLQHATVFGEWLSNSPNLPRFQMEHCSINDDMFIAISKGLARNYTVFEVGVGNNEIGDAGLEAFSKLVLMNEQTNIMRLIMFQNHIAAKGAQCLADALAGSWTVTELNLSNQNGGFDDEAVNLLCEGLKKNQSLYTLRIGHNQLTSDCCRGLGEVVKVHPTLGRLEVQHNKQIGAEGFQLLSQGLEHSTRLKTLNLGDTSPGKQGGKALKDALFKQYKNTTKLIKDTIRELTECEAIKQCVKENDVNVFSSELINMIVTDYVGYALLKQLDLKNCYPELLKGGVLDLAELVQQLRNEGHDLRVVCDHGSVPLESTNIANNAKKESSQETQSLVACTQTEILHFLQSQDQ